MILVQNLQYQIGHGDCNGSRDNDDNDDEDDDGVAWALDAVDGEDSEVWSQASPRLLGKSHAEFQLDNMLLIHRWMGMINM